MDRNGLEVLIKCLKILALDENMQKEHLKALGVFPCTDEMAIDFDYAFQFFIAHIDSEKFILTDFMYKIKLINDLLDSFSDFNDTEIWSVNSLGGNKWEEVRQLAIDALKLLD